jgi:hypothetical protein
MQMDVSQNGQWFGAPSGVRDEMLPVTTASTSGSTALQALPLEAQDGTRMSFSDADRLFLAQK